MNAADTGDGLGITLGVEEEFFLVDPATRDLLADPDEGIFEACEQAGGPHKVVHEFLRSQIETNTRVCNSVADVRTALRETRPIGRPRGGDARCPRAGGLHPPLRLVAGAVADARGALQAVRHHVPGDRAPRPRRRHAHSCGLRRSEDSRIRVMTALRRYLPFLHALSASSPFNGGHETGFKSFRLTVMGALPRTGLPRQLHSQADYEWLVAEYRRMEYIGDARELWWDIRPASAFPTIELRICDVCTRLEDAVTIAALYASLIRRLLRQDRDGALPSGTAHRAHRPWTAGSPNATACIAFFGDRGSGGGRVDIDDYAAALVDELVDDARALGCEAEVRGALDIIREGTGADRQADLYRLRRLEGDSEEQALLHVVDQILAETKEGVESGTG